ncbi:MULTISPECIES: GNAT family N-acetyltransferase [unclassified Acinetobacter]|uniref:GNAT family N-acetyltransferase n=1 Tax=unclassified Acinetobacter TaxID=196816 RepID=UPI0015D3E72C|nr:MULTISPECIES: N-acetyltransferase [unclassified Acinetobacter]UNW06573.1 N-acetyltransferase [Acinetobacter variabilis]
MKIIIRDERLEDIPAIAKLTRAAFQNTDHSSHTEQFIVNALRTHGQLTISLVAIENNQLVGHVAISPVTISSGETGWYGLGPISVLPAKQGQGIGTLLIRVALDRLQQLGAQGCVVLGDPQYYGRFGFKAFSELYLKDVPSEYFQVIAFNGSIPQGEVVYHEAFNATQ